MLKHVTKGIYSDRTVANIWTNPFGDLFAKRKNTINRWRCSRSSGTANSHGKSEGLLRERGLRQAVWHNVCCVIGVSQSCQEWPINCWRVMQLLLESSQFRINHVKFIIKQSIQLSFLAITLFSGGACVWCHSFGILPDGCSTHGRGW